MGIPYYYKDIISKYKTIIKDKIPQCDYLLLDFNSVIHQCAARVIQKCPITYTHDMIIDEIVQQTVCIIEKLMPTKAVLIAVDGVAPVAKMVQQRKRRYITALKTEVIKEFIEQRLIDPPSPWNSDWDSNIITPGTAFMTHLDTRLTEFFSSREAPYNVIVSGSNERGEGEQKLFDYLKRTCTGQDVIIINGLDADLIMLSLLSNHSIFLQRDEETFVDICEFRQSICNHVNPDNPAQEFMWDYVFLCFLLGNDFIPNIPFLKIRNGGVDILLDIYRSIQREIDSNLVITKDAKHFSVNFRFLQDVFKKLTDMEKENMHFACTKYTDTTYIRSSLPSLPENCNKQLKKFLVNFEQFPLNNRHHLTSGSPKSIGVTWQSEYYHDLFRGHDSKNIEKYCNAYIEGLLWITNYYYNRNYDHFWSYPYTLSPLASDIYKTMLTLTMDQFNSMHKKLDTNSHAFEITPLLQLLCVIPPHSISIFPKHVQKLLTDPSHNMMQCFPTKFKLCTFMKTFLWECTPVLPDIDIVHAHNTLIQNQW